MKPNISGSFPLQEGFVVVYSNVNDNPVNVRGLGSKLHKSYDDAKNEACMIAERANNFDVSICKVIPIALIKRTIVEEKINE